MKSKTNKNHIEIQVNEKYIKTEEILTKDN